MFSLIACAAGSVPPDGPASSDRVSLIRFSTTWQQLVLVAQGRRSERVIIPRMIFIRAPKSAYNAERRARSSASCRFTAFALRGNQVAELFNLLRSFQRSARFRDDNR